MIFAPGGGIEAAQEAKKAGKVRYIGFTGHKDPNILLDMLSHDYEWDAVQIPISLLDTHFRSFLKNVVPELIKRGIGVIAMKSLAAGILLRAEVVTPKQALYYTWSQPVATIVSGMANIEHLRANVRYVQEFNPLSEKEQQTLLAQTRQIALTGEYEPFKTTRRFDGRIRRQLHGIKD